MPPRLHRPIFRTTTSPLRPTLRSLSTTQPLRQHRPTPPPASDTPSPPRYNFYRTHGRAFFKSFTLAFLTMQLVQWAWLVAETEEEKDARNAEIRKLEGEVRLLGEGRGSHRLKGVGVGGAGMDEEEG
ncbi:uncharacterized protein HMPREF1541_07034 [Cyphellophora europaea CBS 101466]|uniref:Uncharacterized protein n=1 Tax=Cyphellophora europaea (strain CBS 101466) TaxID=1220924 RepID=W2RRB4_CYPE1|nr:uncharacterized protein HMPREF1541_07034 [Cyphellophora europaea CBS 101466]ETN38992.1 hypothetical protein HMPREF1541_07034 [Cyphellophora europaea CBS 101466]